MDGYAIKTPSFEFEEEGFRQRPQSILWFVWSRSSMVVLTTFLTFIGIISLDLQIIMEQTQTQLELINH